MTAVNGALDPPSVPDEPCAGVVCREQERKGRARHPAGRGLRLCARCRDGLLAGLRALPRLYEECGRLLGGSDGPRERTSGGPMPGMPFNVAAAEARSETLNVLGSWSGMVAAERGVPAPRRTAPALAGFLATHLNWLAAHDAAAELTEEVDQLVRSARRVAYPDPLHRVPIGTCVEVGCAGELVAFVARRAAPSDQGPAEISCEADPRHRWSGHQWLQLARRLHGGAGEEGVAGACWLSAADIVRLWRIPSGSVYRLASERGWRRRSSGSRTYYHEADVIEALSGRTG